MCARGSLTIPAGQARTEESPGQEDGKKMPRRAGRETQQWLCCPSSVTLMIPVTTLATPHSCLQGTGRNHWIWGQGRMAQVAFPDQDNTWLISNERALVLPFSTGIKHWTFAFPAQEVLSGLKGSIFQGSIPCAGGHHTRGGVQQNRRDVPAALQVQPVSALISHLFLFNWHSSISILTFAEEIFLPHNYVLQLHQNSHSACGAAAKPGIRCVSPLLEFQYYYLDILYKDLKYWSGSSV